MSIGFERWLRFAGSVVDLLRDNGNPEWFDNVKRAGQIEAPCGHLSARHALREMLQATYGYRLYSESLEADQFCRGDFELKQIPCERAVKWVEVPIVIAAHLNPLNGTTLINLQHWASTDLRLNAETLRLFHQRTACEFDACAEHLAHCGEFRPNSDRDRSETADYELLGLASRASWDDVHAAFRSASLQFHPDCLSGRDLPSHLIELAESHFKEISAAYQRIKQRRAAQ